MAEPVEDAGSLWQEGVWLLPPDVCPSSGHETAQASLRRWRHQTEVDHQTGKCLGEIILSE